MKKFISNKIVLTILGIFIFIGLWALISLLVDENNIIFPGPIATIKETIIILKGKYVYKCIFSTFYRMLIGFIVSLIIALILGTIAGNISQIKTIFKR